MTDHPPPPPGQQQPAYGDAKAHAKAAKAYAKAQRPWYKKKRWITLIAVVAVVVIASAASGGGSDSDSDNLKASDSQSETTSKDNDDTTDDTADDKKDDDKAEEKSDSDPLGSKDNPAPPGKAVQNKSAKYQIDNVEVRDSLGDFSDAPSGKYVVVTLTVENVKDETIQIGSGDFTLQVGGNEIDASDEAFVLDDAFSYDDLSPGLKRTGVVVFDVAPQDAGKGVLQAQAQLSMDDAVYLKLTKK